MLPLSLVQHKCSFKLTGAEPECLNSAHAMVMTGNLIRMQPLQTQLKLKLMNMSLSIIIIINISSILQLAVLFWVVKSFEEKVGPG